MWFSPKINCTLCIVKLHFSSMLYNFNPKTVKWSCDELTDYNRLIQACGYNYDNLMNETSRHQIYKASKESIEEIT